MTFEEYEALWSNIPELDELHTQLRNHAICGSTVHCVCKGNVDMSKPLEAYKEMPSEVYKTIETIYSKAPSVLLQYKLGLIEVQELPF